VLILGPEFPARNDEDVAPPRGQPLRNSHSRSHPRTPCISRVSGQNGRFSEFGVVVCLDLLPLSKSECLRSMYRGENVDTPISLVRVLLKRFAFAGRKGFVGTAGLLEPGRCTTPARSRRESKRNRRAIHQGFLADSMGFDGATGILSTQLQYSRSSLALRQWHQRTANIRSSLEQLRCPGAARL